MKSILELNFTKHRLQLVRMQNIRWVKFSQKHNYKYMAKLWCLLATENYMFRPIAAVIRF